MTLEEKGPVVPPPVLGKYPEQVSQTIQGWKNIIAATHWNLYNRQETDGADFYVGEEELGHIHLDGEVHLATGKPLATLLIKQKLGEKFPYGQEWISNPITSAAGAVHATWLFKINYERIKGMPMDELIASINRYRETFAVKHKT